MARVLIVDDEPAALKILKRILERDNHFVVTAQDGDQALEAIYTNEVPFDLVLLDLLMPRFDGWDFLRMKRMNRRLEKTAVIIVSSAVTDELRKSGALQGAAMIFDKPIDIEKLQDLISNATRDTIPPPPPPPKPSSKSS